MVGKLLKSVTSNYLQSGSLWSGSFLPFLHFQLFKSSLHLFCCLVWLACLACFLAWLLGCLLASIDVIYSIYLCRRTPSENFECQIIFAARTSMRVVPFVKSICAETRTIEPIAWQPILFVFLQIHILYHDLLPVVVPSKWPLRIRPESIRAEVTWKCRACCIPSVPSYVHRVHHSDSLLRTFSIIRLVSLPF